MSFLQYSMQGVMPAHSPQIAVSRPVVLPFGGPVGTGGAFSQGQALGCVGGAAANAVRTLSLASTPSGTVTVTYVADKIYQTSFAYNATTATVQTALGNAIPAWAGNITVTGTAGSSYVVTFGNKLAGVRIGGALSATITSGTASWANTTLGSAGALQFDVYNSSTNDRVDAFLQYPIGLDAGGGYVGEFFSTGQPFTPQAWIKGFFNAADLVGLDSNALTLGKLIVGSQGINLTDTGLVLELI